MQMQHDLLEGPVESESLTVEQLFNLWINSPTKGGRPRSSTTRYNDVGRFSRYVRPALGSVQACDVRPRDLSLLYEALLTRPQPKSGQPLSPRSVHHVHSMLRAMFQWACRREYTRDNPASRADSPTVHLAPPVAPEREVVAAHLTVMWEENQDLALATWLGATLGLRRSEIVGLRWSDIDLDNGVMRIRHGVTKTPGARPQLTNTKTGLHGQATFPIHSETAKRLTARLADFRTQLELIGVPPGADGFVLSACPEHSAPLHPDVLTKAMRSHCRRHQDLEAITLQALRKYAASDLADTGVDEVTASALLRNQPETARRHYQAARVHRVRRHALGIGDRLAGAVG